MNCFVVAMLTAIVVCLACLSRGDAEQLHGAMIGDNLGRIRQFSDGVVDSNTLATFGIFLSAHASSGLLTAQVKQELDRSQESVETVMDDEQERLQFEREKWRAEVELREREVALKEREGARSRWTSPLVVALLAAAAAAFGNALVTLINGSQQRALERTRGNAQLALEESKAESARVLEMIKTGDSDKAADNLRFLLDAGLISDTDRVARLQAFLEQRNPGAGPSLPAPGSPVQFEQTSALTGAMQSRLGGVLARYASYLKANGFVDVPENATVRIDNLDAPNAFYDSRQNAIVIDARLAGDSDVALREYTHHVLISTFRPPALRPQLMAIESGLADYFPCSFSDDPEVAEIAAAALGIHNGPVRSLVNDRSFAELSGNIIAQDGGEIWGAALWAVREQLGKEVLDPLIARAWLTPGWETRGIATETAFIGAIVRSARDTGQDTAAEAVRKIFRERGFPVGS